LEYLGRRRGSPSPLTPVSPPPVAQVHSAGPQATEQSAPAPLVMRVTLTLDVSRTLAILHHVERMASVRETEEEFLSMLSSLMPEFQATVQSASAPLATLVTHLSGAMQTLAPRTLVVSMLTVPLLATGLSANVDRVMRATPLSSVIWSHVPNLHAASMQTVQQTEPELCVDAGQTMKEIHLSSAT